MNARIEALADAGLQECCKCHEWFDRHDTRGTPDGRTVCVWDGAVPVKCGACQSTVQLSDTDEDGRCFRCEPDGDEPVASTLEAEAIHG